MGLNNRGTVKECNQLPFLVTFLNLALIYCHIPFKMQFEWFGPNETVEVIILCLNRLLFQSCNVLFLTC